MFAYAKTKIVCTIGPASNSFDTLKGLIKGGMSIARLNLAHGSLSEHAQIVTKIRQAAIEMGRDIALLLDLPGPKIRLGKLAQEPLTLTAGEEIFLSTTPAPYTNILPIQMSACMRNGTSDAAEILMKALKPGHNIFINDGLVQLVVTDVRQNLIHCKVVVGGTLMSHKGINLPGVDLDISAITDKDREGIGFAAENGIDAISLSFVQDAKDIEELRDILQKLDYNPLVFAKIERSQALTNIEEILEKADGIMVARGDLGVETPIEQMALVQKKLIKNANEAGKPVILATQMLESMLHNRRPTRAEATDVANAILDGADCIMLSEETAIGEYPVEAVEMMTAIAKATERSDMPYAHLTSHMANGHKANHRDQNLAIKDIISTSVEHAVSILQVALVAIPTQSGTTVRRISRLRLPVWLMAFAESKKICQDLLFSWGTMPHYLKNRPKDWPRYLQNLTNLYDLKGEYVVLVQGPAMLNTKKDHGCHNNGQKTQSGMHKTYRFEVIELNCAESNFIQVP